jgi:sugar/nucleoside kinase (ribokinase family)
MGGARCPSVNPPPVIVLGDIVTDIMVHPHGPIAWRSDTRVHMDVRAGGSGANQAVWLARCRPNVHLVARVGDDPFAAFHLAELDRAGVTTHVTVDPEGATGLIVILLDLPGERTMLTDPGANVGMPPSALPRDLFAPGAHFHHTGYCYFYREEAARAGVHLARASGMTVSVDPSSSSFLEEMGAQRFLDLTRGLDFCFPNLDEGQVLTGESDPEAIVRALAGSYGEVALKLGASGAIWAGGREIVALAAEPAEVVDTTGAGDAFCAGFLSARLGGARPEDSLRSGLRLAAQAVARVGARPE